VTPAPSCRIGIDLGGTKIEGVALADNGQEAARIRIDAPRNDYGLTLDAIAALVDELSAMTACAQPIGVGIPGAISPKSGLVKNANSTWLIGHPLDRDLAAQLDRPVRLAVIDGRAIGGRNAIAGEWGHNPLPWPQTEELPGPACYCGKHGCIETFLSGPGLAADHQRVTEVALTPEAIATGTADPTCKDTIDRYVDRLARALAHVINILDPDVIVLGGGASNITALYDLVPARWGRYVFSDEVATSLLPARHGDSSGVRGAARLWP